MEPQTSTKKVYVAADADEAGEKFAQQVLKWIMQVSSTDPEVIYPVGGVKDFGDMTAEQIRSMGL